MTTAIKAEQAGEQPQAEEPKAQPLQLRELLTDEDELAVFARLEELKLSLDKDTKEFEDLRLEAGALIAVAGGTSGAYGQIVVALTAGGSTKKFEPDRLLTQPITCPHCGQTHNFPAGQLAGLYAHTARHDSVSVSIAGSKGRKKAAGDR